jgi:hypothetical protein
LLENPSDFILRGLKRQISYIDFLDHTFSC